MTSTPTAPAIVATDVHRSFGTVDAVAGLALAVPAGSITSILGSNGAGKTTTLEILAGLRNRDRGDVRVLGTDPWQAPAAHRARVGVMLQEGGVWSTTPPQRAITHVARFYSEPLDPAELIDRLGLSDVARTPFRRLSGGEKQRVKMACALVGRPGLVLLDEPSSGLDPRTRLSIWALLGDLREAGVTVVLSTHSLPEAQELSDHVVVIDSGRVVAAGSVEELSALAGPATVDFRATPQLDTRGLARACPGGTDVEETAPGQYRVRSTAADSELMAAVTAWCAQSGVVPANLQVRRPTLEDAFLTVTGDGAHSASGEPLGVSP